MLAHGQFMLLMYAQQMKGRKLTIGEASNMLKGYEYHLGKYLNMKG